MSNTPQTNSNNLQDIIDAKIALIASIPAKLALLVTAPKTAYDIDGQQVDWTSYRDWLLKMQIEEPKAIAELIKLKNTILPYWYQRRGR